MQSFDFILTQTTFTEFFAISETIDLYYYILFCVGILIERTKYNKFKFARFFLPCLVHVTALTIDEMLLSKAVAVTFAEKNLGSFAWIIPVGVCISVFGSLNGSILTGPRVQFVAARHGHLPDVSNLQPLNQA